MSSLLFSPVTLGNLELKNRIVISPMCQYSAEEGRAADWHLIHYGQFSFSGAGLMIESQSIHREEADSAPAVDGVLFGDGGGGHVVGLHVIRWHGRIAVDRLRCRGTGVGTQHVDQSDRAISPSGIRAYWHVVWSAAHVHLYRVYRCVLIEWRVLR